MNPKLEAGRSYRALERTSIEYIAIEVHDGKRRLVVGAELDESVATILLVPDLHDLPEVEEKRMQILIRGERS